MLKSRFRSLPGAFNANLISLTPAENATGYRKYFSLQKSYKPLDEHYSNLQSGRVDTPVHEDSHPHAGQVFQMLIIGTSLEQIEKILKCLFKCCNVDWSVLQILIFYS